jgi:hypothetical protein
MGIIKKSYTATNTSNAEHELLETNDKTTNIRMSQLSLVERHDHGARFLIRNI